MSFVGSGSFKERVRTHDYKDLVPDPKNHFLSDRWNQTILRKQIHGENASLLDFFGPKLKNFPKVGDSKQPYKEFRTDQ